MSRFKDTIAALATPVGTSAIAVVRVSGPDAARLAQVIFGDALRPRVARHCDYYGSAGALLDDVLFTFYRGPNSYTGEDSFEISCHGNPFIAQKILEDLFARGCRPAEPGEFTQRAFLNGRMDLSQAEAVMEIIHARSERALSMANDQLRGALSRRMNALIDRLLVILARIEAYIDFPDEDLPPEDRGLVLNELLYLARETDKLLATSHYGAVLRDGVKTVIVGAPNVGKSSLLNFLAGRERALVSPEPGTTRDFIEERLLIGPYCVRLVDTAGLNPSPSTLERRGMEKTLEMASEADLLLLVLDAAQPSVPNSEELKEYLRVKSTLVIVNKCDLGGSSALPRELEGIRAPLLRVSTLTGAGMADLADAISRRVDSFQHEVGDEAVAISSRHTHVLTRASAGLCAARANVEEASPVELLASDLRDVLAAYGEIVGKVDNERVLDQLFTTFCIGK